MTITISGVRFDNCGDISLGLAYDGIASTFKTEVYYDPDNAEHVRILKPSTYPPVVIEHNGEVMLTGVLVYHRFKSSATTSLLSIAGYSKTGVLEDCGIPMSAYPLQTIGLSLSDIAERILKHFGLKLVVDNSVAARAKEKYAVSTAQDSDSIKSYLSELSCQKHIIVTHTPAGDLLLTEANTKALPIYDFTEGAPEIEMEFVVNGQQMHSEIDMVKQATKTGKGNSGQSSIKNPYCSVFRPKVNRQTSSSEVDTGNAVRSSLSDELKSISLKIMMYDWYLGGKMVKPNNIITVTNPSLGLPNKTKFFIESVEYQTTGASQQATLTCYLPEVYCNEEVKNIFL